MSCVHAQPFARFHPCADGFLLLQMKTEKNFSFPVEEKKRDREKNLPIVMLASFSFETSDGWSWSFTKKLVNVIIQDEDSKSKINYPAAAPEFSCMSYHKDAPCTNVSMGTCAALIALISSLHCKLRASAVRLMLSYGEFPFLQGHCTG